MFLVAAASGILADAVWSILIEWPPCYSSHVVRPRRFARGVLRRRGGQTFTLREMLMFFLINDMIVPGSTYWNMVFGRLPGEVWKETEGIATIRHFAANVANLVKRLHPETTN